MRHAELPLVVIVLALALAVRLVALSSDPPGWLSWSAGIYSDEGIYSNDARMLVLDAQHEPGNFKVSIIAPLQHRLLLAVFHRFGVSLRIVRLVAVVFSMGTLAAFWLTLRLEYDRTTALVGLTLLAVSAPFVLYNRLGLLEMPALFWLTIGYLMLAVAHRVSCARRRFAALLLAGLFAGIAIAWKGTFLLGALPLLACAVWRHRAMAIAAAGGAAASLAAYCAVFYLPHREDIARISDYYIEHQYLPHSMAGVVHDVARGVATGDADGVMPYLFRFAPALLLFALCALLPKVRAKDDLWLWLWAGVPIVVLLFSNYTPSRYFMIFWPALAALAGCAIVRLLPRRRPAIAAVLAVCVILNGAMLWTTYRTRTYTLRNDGLALAKTLPRDAWIAGQFAPAVCLDNNLRTIYVQQGLANNGPTALSDLPISHVLATRMSSTKDDPWAGQYGNLIAGPAGLISLPVGRKFTIDLYANKEALP
jgi:4-amino-4-deoxy-L-arabinose transferase-like glycosyltransferase